LLAALSGFEDDTPGIGAFYDFSRRFKALSVRKQAARRTVTRTRSRAAK